MTTRKELEDLLSSYETANGSGNLKQAGRILPKIVRALVSFVEERTPDHVEPIVASDGKVLGSLVIEAGLTERGKNEHGIDILAEMREAANALVTAYEDSKDKPIEEPGFVELLGKVFGDDTVTQFDPKPPLGPVFDEDGAPTQPTESLNDRPTGEPCPPCDVTTDSDLTKFGMTEELKAQLDPAKKTAATAKKPAPKTPKLYEPSVEIAPRGK